MRTLLFFAAVVAAAMAFSSFSADVFIENDPAVWGTVSGRMSYLYDTTTDGKQHYRAVTYTLPGNVVIKEIINYTDTTRYLYCGTCQAEGYKNPADKFFLDSADVNSGTTRTIGSVSCTKYTRTAQTTTSITEMWLAANTAPCMAVYSNGKKITFSNVDTTQLTASSPVFSYASWNCKAKVCNIIMDLVLVLDESGSIVADDWKRALQFARDLTSQFTLSPTAVNVGVVTFDDVARTQTKTMAVDKSIINMMYYLQHGGWTCIGCGLNNAADLFNGVSSARAAMRPSRVLVLVTDGQNNRPENPWWWTKSYDYCDQHLRDAAANLDRLAVTRIAVAVGTQVSDNDLSTVTGGRQDLIMRISNYGALQSIISSLVGLTCSEFPDEPCGSGCRGFCSCGKTCLCPSTCTAPDACTQSSCSTGANYNGCLTQNKSIDDRNACTLDTCDPSTGPAHSTISPDDGNACTTDSCDPATGMIHQPTPLPAPSTKCKVPKCDPARGMYEVNLTCDDGDACTVDTCDPAVGCVYTAKDCGDGDLCTQDVCTNGVCSHPATDCAASQPDRCHPAKCDRAIGCIFPSMNCTDGDPCTRDGCDRTSGTCTHEAITPCELCASSSAPTCVAPDACTSSTCTQVGTGAGAQVFCKNATWKDDPSFGCNSNDKCILDSCNPATGQCSHVSNYQACTNGSQNCVVGFCDPADGACKTRPVVCKAVDACHTATCDPASGLCQQLPACPDQTCAVVTCTIDATQAAGFRCSVNRSMDAVCPSGSACKVGTCDNATGKCSFETRNCSDGLFCTRDLCDPATGCINPATACDTADLCVVGHCNETLKRCWNTSFCDDRKYCTDDFCAINSTGSPVCQHSDFVCNNTLKDSEQSCYQYVCKEATHCVKMKIRSAYTNPCGQCMGAEVSKNNSNMTGTVCFGNLQPAQFAGALTAGVIGGIAAAAVIGFLIFSAVSAFGTYKLISMAKAGQGMAAHNNPMYKPSDNESVNPAYGQK